MVKVTHHVYIYSIIRVLSPYPNDAQEAIE